MDNKTDYRNNNSLKTDLRLLLECLKFQMKSPDLQKQSLLTIHSICEKREDTVDILRELGGVTFIQNLSKSSVVHEDVKEAALFTLGTVAEANVYCKNSLCRKETFVQLACLLMKEDTPLTQKRVSVYFLSVLIANNKAGQTLAQTTGCLDILLDLFRTSFPISTDDVMRRARTNTSQNCQFWTAVCSALCGCVNNPQNEEGQRICVSVFPIVSMWLQQISLPRTEIFQPICSFIAMTVANNSCVQQSFFDSGALDTLALALIRQASAADQSVLSYQLSVTISKTLSACITDNRPLASGLVSYDLVPHLFSVLTSPHLESEDSLSVLLTLCHCTEASEENQFQLVECGGLPLIITLLTEDSNEEVRKAATFILQTCKQATMSLPGLKVRQGEQESEDHLANMGDLRTTTQTLLRQIDPRERRQTNEDAEPAAASRVQPLIPSGSDNSSKAAMKVKDKSNSEVKNMDLNLSTQEESAETSTGGVRCAGWQGTGSVICSSKKSLGGVREHNSADNQFFKPPLTTKQMSSSSPEQGLQGQADISVEERVLSPVRCVGCVLSFDEVTSRTFSSLQSACRHSCDMHKVLQEATERFRVRHCDLLARTGCQFSCVEQTNPDCQTVSTREPQRSWSKESSSSGHKGGRDRESLQKQQRMSDYITLTPKCRRITNSGVSLTPMKTPLRPAERRQEEKRECQLKSNPDCVQERNKRKSFSCEEVAYLLRGVETYGSSWNSILWSYPFKPGRSNVSLAKKYSLLRNRKVKDSVCE
ncbi:telomere repeats-binding bouquet formation protein 1 [Takifugu flavidus]|uniref:telomere repeats-binding bouquet formation protein 1 n=1 Tax=Takifugu flavidus TaxID=433684 RepID=UPI0025448FCB|nr:telomere repeats-binding bouquet formation protein 1 [Takifugu flavidus]